MSGFTYRGIHSSARHLSLLDAPDTVLPAARDLSIPLRRRHGALRFVPTFDERHISLECWLDGGATPAATRTRMDDLLAWLSPLGGPGPLVLDSEPDREYWAMLAPDSIDSRSVSGNRVFSLDFVCPDPFGYSVSPLVVNTSASPYTLTLPGTAPSEPLLRLRGASLGWGLDRIHITVNGVTTTYEGPLEAGDWLEVDSASINSPRFTTARTAVRVTDAGQRITVIHRLRPLVFHMLQPGPNSIEVVAEGDATWTRLEIHTRPRWL